MDAVGGFHLLASSSPEGVLGEDSNGGGGGCPLNDNEYSACQEEIWAKPPSLSNQLSGKSVWPRNQHFFLL